MRRLLWVADGGTLAGAGGEGAWPLAARTMEASVCLCVWFSGYRLREPSLPCIADARVLLLPKNESAGAVGAKVTHCP